MLIDLPSLVFGARHHCQKKTQLLSERMRKLPLPSLVLGKPLGFLKETALFRPDPTQLALYKKAV